jgi:hypothetical protein
VMPVTIWVLSRSRYRGEDIITYTLTSPVEGEGQIFNG